MQSPANRNFALGVINGSLFETAMAFLGLNTVLPVFLSHLTPARWVTGLASAILSAGWLIPQLFLARLWENKPYKMPLYLLGAVVRITMILFLVASVWLYAGTTPVLALILFLVFLTLYSLGSGLSGLPFMEIVAKTVPPRHRASFFSARFFLGGAGAFAGGLAVREILGRPEIFPYPLDYTLIFALCLLFMTIGLGAFLFIQEPPDSDRTTEANPPLGKYLSDSISLLRADTSYIHYLRLRLFLAGGAIAVPFYATHALQVLGIPDAAVGLLISAQTLGAIFSNLAWAYIGDRSGQKQIMHITTSVGMFLPLFALVLSLTVTPATSQVGLGAYCLLFLLLGALMKGDGVAHSAYILDLAPPAKRSTYVGFTNTLVATLSVMPVLGGIIVDLMSYQVAYVISALLLAGAYYSTGKLAEPRLRAMETTAGS